MNIAFHFSRTFLMLFLLYLLAKPPFKRKFSMTIPVRLPRLKNSLDPLCGFLRKARLIGRGVRLHIFAIELLARSVQNLWDLLVRTWLITPQPFRAIPR